MIKSLLNVGLFVLINIAGPIYADQVVLENGDKLTGTVVNIDNGILTFSTDYSDPVKIQSSKIKEVITNTPVEVHLSKGEVLKGTLKTVEDGKVAVESSTDRDTAVVHWANIQSINPPDSSKWTGNMSVGGNQQSGNTDRLSASVGAEAMRKTDIDRFSLRFLFNYAKEDGELSNRNTYAAFKYDYFFTEKIYGYTAIELLADKFKDINLRTVVGPGVGYQLWDHPDKSLGLEAGVSYFSEDRIEAADDDWITARLAGNLRWKIAEKLILTDSLVIYPSLEDTGEYQLRNEAGITSPLIGGWSLRLSNIIEHDSNPPVNIEKDDIYWILSLLYGF